MSQVTTIGDRVKLNESNLVGCVRFIGEIKNKTGVYYGIELDETKGKNNGSIAKIRYFRTASKKGLFIKQSQILKTNSKNNPNVPRVTVGDTVYIKKFDCNAIIRYIGSADFKSKTLRNKRSKSITSYTKKELNNARPRTPTSTHSKLDPFALANIWYGVELKQAKGKNNGSVQGKWYFGCEDKRGSFVRKEQIQIIDITDNDATEEKETECRPDSAKSKLMNAWNWKRNNKQNNKENIDINTPQKTENHLKLKKHTHGRQRSRSLDLSAIMIEDDPDIDKHKTNKKKKKKSKLKRPQTPQPPKQKRADTRKKAKKGRSKSVVQRTDLKQPKNATKSTKSKTDSAKNKPTKRQKPHKKKSGSDVSYLYPAQKKKRTKKRNKKKVSFGDKEAKAEEDSGRIEIVYGDTEEKGERVDDDEKYVTITDYHTDCNKNEDTLFCIGDDVKLRGDQLLLGTIMFIGSVQHKEGIFYGIDLAQTAKGKNDGTFRKKRYFSTQSGTKSGLFVKKERMLKIVRKDRRTKQRICVEDVVYIDKFKCNGTVRFIGNTSFKEGVIWYGIALDEAKGKNDGSVNGEWYFECEDKYGTFMKNSALTKIPKKEINSHEFGRSTSMNSIDSQTPSLISSTDSIDSFARFTKVRYPNIIMEILMTENDLAGFCLIWMLGLFYVIILRANEDKYVVETRWISIFFIPCTVVLCTWIFSFFITKYTNRKGQESMAKPIFYIPFLCKTLVAMIFFGRLMEDIRIRYKDTDEYSTVCTGALVNIWFDCVLSVATAEVLITTVMVNSIQNIDQYRLREENKSLVINAFLFITRPILWVYNRLIVMFISFYLYYYLLFALGPITTYVCNVEEIKSLRDIGLSTLLLPFHNVLYLFEFDKWTHFELSHYEDNSHTMFAVIQQVLVFTTGADLILDIWSVYQLIKGSGEEKEKTENEIQLFQIQRPSPNKLSIIQETDEKVKKD